MHILVVDDDENCRASLGSLLVGEGHDVYTAASGLEAVDLARRWRREERRLDLSFLDYRLPDFSGIETYSKLIVELPETQAIFVSGDTSNTLEELVLSAGGFALMRKPLTLPAVRHVLLDFSRELGEE
jgi:two-component system OmpR family response regulator